MNIVLIVLAVIFLIAVIVLVLYLLARSKGKITLNLDKLEFTPGETIAGNIGLKLKKPVQAKALNVGLLGTMERTSYSKNPKGGTSRNTRYEIVFDFKKPVDGQKTYSGYKDYKFQLKIPSDIYKNSTGNKIADTLVKSAQLLSGKTSKIKWFVRANLDMKGFDIKKKVRINIA